MMSLVKLFNIPILVIARLKLTSFSHQTHPRLAQAFEHLIIADNFLSRYRLGFLVVRLGKENNVDWLV
jgi:hypothetical protein